MDYNNNFTYAKEGHQQPGRQASNLYINFQQAPPTWGTPDYHVTCRYMRNKNDLVYKHQISL